MFVFRDDEQVFGMWRGFRDVNTSEQLLPLLVPALALFELHLMPVLALVTLLPVLLVVPVSPLEQVLPVVRKENPLELCEVCFAGCNVFSEK